MRKGATLFFLICFALHAYYESQKVPSSPKFGPRTPTLRDWETFEFDVGHWVDLLKGIGADEASRRDLFLLAQHSAEGSKSANGVVHKILKKIQDDTPVYNWSGYV